MDQQTDVNVASWDADGAARGLAQAFRHQGEQLYLVGGAVRDHLLGQTVKELDFATSSRPQHTIKILRDLGIQSVYRVGEKFGTIGAVLDGATVEITTYRSEEIYPAGSRKPDVQFGETLLQDLSRRDFTVNAIARDPLTGDLIDPFDGEGDLAAGQIRAVGQPSERFREDPLRMLRAVRFATRLGSRIEEKTWRAMLEQAATTKTISRERVRDELSKILIDPSPAQGLTLLRDSGLLRETAPVLCELDRMPDHGPRHPLSLWDHMLRVVEGVPPILALRWAAVLHDIAKPQTRTTESSGRPRFFHHEEVGAQIARDVLTSLRYPKDMIDAVDLLVETHMQLHSYSAEWSDGAVRRLMLRLGPLTSEALLLARADASGHAVGGPSYSEPKFDHLQQRISALGHEQVQRLKSPLSGRELMERYDRGPGPWIREIKDALLEEVVEGRLASEDQQAAWRIADELAGRTA